MTEQERKKASAYRAPNITACIDCWREALAAGGWPGDTDERRDDEDGRAEGE